jgi:molecular chaperone DnaK
MMKEAESHAEDDKKRREEIETRNRADQAVYGAERMLKDAGDKLAAADKADIETAMADLRKAIDANDTAGMTSGMEKLTAAQHKAAEALYRTQSAPSGTPGGDAGNPGAESNPSGGGGVKDGDVIDAEVVDDKK